MAVSASSARLTTNFFFLVCKLYIKPFSNKVVSLLEKFMFVLFMILG